LTFGSLIAKGIALVGEQRCLGCNFGIQEGIYCGCEKEALVTFIAAATKLLKVLPEIAEDKNKQK